MTFDYLTPKEIAAKLDKSQRRIYQMVEEGILQQAGYVVIRSSNGRVWIGVSRTEVHGFPESLR